MPILTTNKLGRIAAISTAITAVGGIVWSVISYAGDTVTNITKNEIYKTVPTLIDKKIRKHKQETISDINTGLVRINLQMYSIQERMIKSEISDLTKNKKVNELTAPEKSAFDKLLKEQSIIQEEKSKIKNETQIKSKNIN